MWVSRLIKLVVWQYTVLKSNLSIEKTNFCFGHSAVNLIAGWNKLIPLINYFGDSLPCSQMKNKSSVFLHQILSFYLTLVKVFSSKAAIESIAYAGANFLPIAVLWICLQVSSENSKILFVNTSSTSSIKVSVVNYFLHCYPKNP